MLFVFAAVAIAFMVNHYVVTYRSAQKPAASIQEPASNLLHHSTATRPFGKSITAR
jgi:hypothetical protein